MQRYIHKHYITPLGTLCHLVSFDRGLFSLTHMFNVHKYSDAEVTLLDAEAWTYYKIDFNGYFFSKL